MTEKIIDADNRKKLKESNLILTLGILSIVFFTIIGILAAVATLIKASTQIREYNSAPHRYTLKSYKRVKAGKILAITGLLIKVVLIFVIATIQANS